MTKVLKSEYQDLADDFQTRFEGEVCSCHINPPCLYCIHPGNPDALEDNSKAWEEEDFGVRDRDFL